MKRESALVGFGLVALGALGGALALARCTDGEPRPPESAPDSERSEQSPAEVSTGQPSEEAPAPVGKSAVEPATTDEVEPTSDPIAAASASAEAPPVNSGGSTVSRALAAAQPADLELLGRIERELRREPPPEIHAMLRRRSEGATRDELLGMARALPDLQLRVLGLRWVDEVRPAAGADTGANAGSRAPTAPAPGSANPFVKRVEPVR